MMKVLVVDDEEIIRKGLCKLLKQCPKTMMEVNEAKNGRLALDMIERIRPDLVITDIRMPVMDGLELTDCLRQSNPDIHIVILTGYAEFDYARRAIRNGVFDYLLKPVTQEQLDEIILRLVMRSPAPWMERFDADSLRYLRDGVSELVRCVMAENRAGVDHLMDKWRHACKQWNLSYEEVKQLLAHIKLIYKAEMAMVQHDLPAEPVPTSSSAMSLDHLFDQQAQYYHAHISVLASKRAPRNKRVVDLVVQEIGRHYGNPELNIHSLAKAVGISAAYLSKMFREIMHMPITQFITDFRLEQAKNRLERDETVKITQIAEECGFTDYPYFSKVFKKTYGVPPQEYRDKYWSSAVQNSFCMTRDGSGRHG
jgi:two-component system response regulator YesN